MSELQKLFQESYFLSTKWEKYFKIYDDVLTKYKNKKIDFVEIGIFQGGSLEIWKKFFGNQARIIGIDLNSECKKFEKNGFEIFIGNQSNEKFWDNFFNEVGPADIILDDGGHTNEQQIKTVINCLSNIKDGGILITEDTHTSYMSKYGNPHKYSFINFTKKIIDDVNLTYPFNNKKKFKISLNKYVYGISFYESIVIFNVDRARCKINKFLINTGVSSGIEDFKHKDSSLIKLGEYLRRKFKFLKNIKLQQINYFLKNYRLNKFFK